MFDAAVVVQQFRAPAFGQRAQMRDLIGPAADIEQRQAIDPPRPLPRSAGRRSASIVASSARSDAASASSAARAARSRARSSRVSRQARFDRRAAAGFGGQPLFQIGDQRAQRGGFIAGGDRRFFGQPLAQRLAQIADAGVAA